MGIGSFCARDTTSAGPSVEIVLGKSWTQVSQKQPRISEVTLLPDKAPALPVLPISSANTGKVEERARNLSRKPAHVADLGIEKFEMPANFQLPAELHSSYDYDLVFNKDNIKDLVDYMIEDSEGYECILETPEQKCLIKKGFEVEERKMLVKGWYKLDAKYSLCKIYSILCDHPSRPEWDSSVKSCEYITNYSPNLATYHTIIKMPMLMDNRDFAEKRVSFSDNNDTLYFYYSSINDSLFPHVSGLTRGCTIVAACRIQRTQDGIEIWTSTQKDFNILGGDSLGSMFKGRMKEGQQQFKINITKRLEALG